MGVFCAASGIAASSRVSAKDRFFMAIFYSRYFVDRIDRNGRTKMTKALSRRGILQYAGGLLAATTLRGQSSPISPIMTKLSTFMSEAAGHALPADVVEKT